MTETRGALALSPHPHPLFLSASPFSPFWGHPTQMETLWLLVEASFLHKGDTGSIFCHSENISGILWNAHILLSLGPIRSRMSDSFWTASCCFFQNAELALSVALGWMRKLTDSRICAPRVIRPLSKSQRTLSKGTGRTRLGISRCALRHGYRCDWQQCFYERTSKHPRRALHSEQRTDTSWDKKSAVGGASSCAPVHCPPVNTDAHTHTHTTPPSTGLADDHISQPPVEEGGAKGTPLLCVCSN